MADWATAKTMTAKVKVNLNEQGFIAQDGDTVAATKYISTGGLSAGGSLDDVDAVWGYLYSTIGGGSYDTVTAQKTTTQGVDE